MLPNLERPTADYTIRPLRPADLAAISRVHGRACRIADRFRNWSYTEAEVRAWCAHRLPGWDWGLVACADSPVIAYIAAIGGHVDQLFVDPDHQRAGVGSALLAAMLNRQLRPATLNVFAENAPARAFYERFGFREVDGWWNEEDSARELLYRLD
jgi:ribosomal protein S18 acetylase RimI-like enzyme